jgi:hypothetical protein
MIEHYFSFRKDYLKSMLLILIKGEFKVLKDMFQLFEDLKLKSFNKKTEV